MADLPPTPWRAEPAPAGDGDCFVVDANGRLLIWATANEAVDFAPGVLDLVLAAPDLLAACNAVWAALDSAQDQPTYESWRNGVVTALKTVEAAIAKAKVRTDADA